MSERRDAVVIGAGAAGLAVARSLEDAGMRVCVLERSHRVAASWWQRYEGLRLNTVRWLSDLPFARMAAQFGRWPDREQWASYLGRYAAQLREVVLGTTVLRVEQTRGGWCVHTATGAWNAPYVIVATGHDRVPVIPQWHGVEAFTGQFIHSAQFRTVEELKGKSVLVVGTGNSGIEIATLLSADDSIRTSISVRTVPLMLKRELGPVPVTLLAELGRLLPDRLIDWCGRAVHRRLWSDLAPFGLGETSKRLSMMRHTYYSPPLDNGFAAAVQRGDIEIVPAVTGFDGESVFLDGGERRAYDVVIAATGFRPGLEDMVGDLGVVDEKGEPKVAGGEQLPGAPGLFFAGFRFGLFALLPYLEGDARAITRAISGKTPTADPIRRPLKTGALAP